MAIEGPHHTEDENPRPPWPDCSEILTYKDNIRITVESSGAMLTLPVADANGRFTNPEIQPSSPNPYLLRTNNPESYRTKTALTRLRELRRLILASKDGVNDEESFDVWIGDINGILYLKTPFGRVALIDGQPVVIGNQPYSDPSQGIIGLDLPNVEMDGNTVIMTKRAENSKRRYVVVEDLDSPTGTWIERVTGHNYPIEESDAISNHALNRSENYDAARRNPEKGIFVVADGNATYPESKIYAEIAVEEIDQGLQGLTDADLSNFTPRVFEGIIESICEKIVQRIKRDGGPLAEEKNTGIGTTLAVVFVHNGVAYHAEIGDSRIYHFTEKSQSLSLETREEIGLFGWLREFYNGSEVLAGAVMDQCLRAMNSARSRDQVIAKLASVFQDNNLPTLPGSANLTRFVEFQSIADFWDKRNLITNTINAAPAPQGKNLNFAINMGYFPVEPSDLILLATDFIDNLTDPEIQYLLQLAPDVVTACDWIELCTTQRIQKNDKHLKPANERAHDDDRTVVLCKVGKEK